MPFSAITTAETDTDSPLTGSLVTRLWQNPLAIAAGDAGAPKVAIDFSGQTAIGTDNTTTTDVLTPDGSGGVVWTPFTSLETAPYAQINESYSRDPGSEVESENWNTGYDHFIAYVFVEYLWNDTIDQVAVMVVNSDGTHGAMAEVLLLGSSGGGNLTDLTVTTSGSSISISVGVSPGGERLRHISGVAFQLNSAA